jgi:hypothetical protein
MQGVKSQLLSPAPILAPDAMLFHTIAATYNADR